MFCLNDTMRYFHCLGKTDMRKGMSSLCGVIHERMGHNIKHGDVFIFIGSGNKLMKLLHAEEGGLVMYVKRLEAMANGKTTMTDIRVIIRECPCYCAARLQKNRQRCYYRRWFCRYQRHSRLRHSGRKSR